MTRYPTNSLGDLLESGRYDELARHYGDALADWLALNPAVFTRHVAAMLRVRALEPHVVGALALLRVLGLGDVADVVADAVPGDGAADRIKIAALLASPLAPRAR